MTAEGEGAPARESRRVEITVLGQTLTLRTEESPEYLRALAAYIESRVQTLRQSGVQDSARVLVLAALDITDELFRARERLQDEKLGARLTALRVVLDDAVAGAGGQARE